jgi:hypothetical protein
MTLIAQFTRSTQGPETLVGVLAIVALIGVAIWASFRWLRGGQASPEPWDEQVARDLEKDDAVPLCHHCLSAHDSRADFCPDCGAPVGQYTNYLPFPVLFSAGYTLRLGTAGDFKHSPLAVCGFLLFAFAQNTLLAPVYWIIFLRNLFNQPPRPPSTSESIENP